MAVESATEEYGNQDLSAIYQSTLDPVIQFTDASTSDGASSQQPPCKRKKNRASVESDVVRCLEKLDERHEKFLHSFMEMSSKAEEELENKRSESEELQEERQRKRDEEVEENRRKREEELERQRQHELRIMEIFSKIVDNLKK
ncbi:Uncharacterised protein g956 [Pycnogonum litorale]